MSSVTEVSYAARRTDRIRVDAVERCIERIAKASIRIGAERMAEIALALPLPGVCQLGNVLRHDYGEKNTRLVYAVVVDRMPRLRAACVGESRQSPL